MFRQILVAGAFAAASVGGAAGSAGAADNTTMERYHVDLGVQVEQAPHCTDEAITWTGGYDVTITTTTTATGTTRSLNYLQHLDGVGAASGGTYDLTARYHEVSRTSTTGAQVYAFGETYVQRSRGGSPDYLAQSSTTQVITPNGITIDPGHEGEDGDVGHWMIRCVG